MIIWSIDSMQRYINDGIVFLVNWKASITDGNDTIETSGSTTLEQPNTDIILYENLTEEIVLEWVKSRIDVNQIESSLLVNIETLQKSNILNKLPWDTAL
jgi:hypothetical protein